MRQNHFRERIIDALNHHPEGLTTVDIAKSLGTHRHTVTKYVYQLVGEGVIHQREIGNAKLCYVKEEKNGN
jgi:DNA-binding IclR family transcriptional regulator